eukprot:SAG11_NODE_1409_length_4997_cov_4.521846_4_plen_72_part_00
MSGKEEDQEHFENYMTPYIKSSTWRNTDDIATYIYAMFEVKIPRVPAITVNLRPDNCKIKIPVLVSRTVIC